MRSQTTKPPKKGVLSKTTLKTNFPTTQVKKKAVLTKKVKHILKKSLVKNPKKNISKDDASDGKTDDSSTDEKSDSSLGIAKAGSSRASSARSESPSKKNKKEFKEKKESPIITSESSKVVSKKILNKTNKSPAKRVIMKKDDNDDVKYKINSNLVKKSTVKMSRAKLIGKKRTVSKQNKKSKTLNKQSTTSEDLTNDEIEAENKIDKEDNVTKDRCSPKAINQTTEDNEESKKSKDEESIENSCNSSTKSSIILSTSSNQKTITPEVAKTETERPPKFFTSTRSPRTIDIDVKCCKTSKGNLSVSEKIISKCLDPKSDEQKKEKQSFSSNLISPGPDIDVYTFTEKVDSPKNILSDFKNPDTKNIGRVRPIARVKGTIIDKKNEFEKKKYSPHRPIEEVVKQLKAKRGSEEQKSSQTYFDISSSIDSSPASDEKCDDEKPKPIVSKSYKMVARKSSIPGKPFSPIKFLDQEDSSQIKSTKLSKSPANAKKICKVKLKPQKSSMSDDEIDNSKFSLNTNKSKSHHYSSSEESIIDSNDDNDTKESSEAETNKNNQTRKTKKYKKITDVPKKNSSRELKELSKDSLVDLKDDVLLGTEKPSKRRLKLLSMWTGPKKHRMASLNAIAKVHCLYENESRTHMELGLMKTVDRLVVPSTAPKPSTSKKKEKKQKDTSDEKQDTTSESEYESKDNKKDESSEDDSQPINTRTLRGVPAIRKSAGKYWDHKSSTSSSEDSELESVKKKPQEKKKVSPKSVSSKSDTDKPPTKMKKTTGVPVKKKRNRTEVVMDLKDMVVQKRMASLNATAILAASYEKRSPKSNKDETTSDSCSDESFSQKSKNGVSSGVKSETKTEETKKETEEPATADRKQKVEVIVNQDTDVTITGVYATHHHEGFCTVAGMQYRISSTSHTQTTATANCEKEGCPREDGARYTPLSALSSMQPPADHGHPHPHPVGELGGLARRAAGCSSAFSAPSPSAHHEPGKEPIVCSEINEQQHCGVCKINSRRYYQPAGPLIKESGSDADRTLARYHPPHYHPPHPPVLQQYGPPYYPTEMCYGRYYRPPGPYHIPPPPQPDQMVGVPGEPYPPPQYYSAPPCYQHSPQRVPYIEYRGCPCPMNACPKNVLIGPATGKAPAGGGPDVSPLATPGGAFRAKVRACADADAHGSGKDPPLEPEPPAAADAPRPCPLPALGGASPKRELFEAREEAGGTRLGPPSPARGSAGACAPQPPPAAPRRARLGKAMARRTLAAAGDDTALLLAAHARPPPPHSAHSDADDDVLAVSPPTCVPIDLSSSDETDRRSTPLVDVKKENEGPTNSSPRKTDTQALKEHNCSMAESMDPNGPAKPAKRRYSKPKMEIELGEVQLEDGCRTNGIGEHVKLQKRRKISSEVNDVTNRPEAIVPKEPKKKATPKVKRAPKTITIEKKALKRKIEMDADETEIKKGTVTKPDNEDARLKNIAALPQEHIVAKPKNKSALLLDNLLRKNSIDRDEAINAEINPAALFLTSSNGPQNCTNKTLNINNNVIENNLTVNGVKPKTIAAVSQLIERKLAASKNALKAQKVESKITQSLKSVKSVLSKPKIEKQTPKQDSNQKVLAKIDTFEKDNTILSITDKSNDISIVKNMIPNVESLIKTPSKLADMKTIVSKLIPSKKQDPINVSSEPFASNKNEVQDRLETAEVTKPDAVVVAKAQTEKKPEKISAKRSKLSIDKVNSELKSKSAEKSSCEKVGKLLVSKKSVIKADEAASVVEDACASPLTIRPSAVRRRRRRSGLKRTRRIPALLPLPDTDESRAPPRWSNGWQWDGENHISKVYLNNDQRQDRTARCYSRMVHTSGDVIARGDCVLLRASPARAQPFVAKVARLWENPEDGEMMVSLVWYYRPEHTELGRMPDDAPDEVFASRHRDANSVACIEDKCNVLTFNEYCRYRKRLKAAEEGVSIAPSIVPPMPAHEVTPAIATNDSKLTPAVSPELVLFCRKIYDFRSKKIQVPNK